MAVTFDSSPAAGAMFNNSAGPITLSHTIGTASPWNILIVGVVLNSANANRISACTYFKGGSAVAMTAVGSAQDTTHSIQAYLYSMLAPDTGAHNISVTLGGKDYGGIVSASYYMGMKVGASLGSNAGSVGNVPVTVTTVQARGILVGVSAKITKTGTYTGVTGGTLRLSGNYGGGSFYALGGIGDIPLGAPGSNTITFTSGTTAYSAIYALEIAEMQVRIVDDV